MEFSEKLWKFPSDECRVMLGSWCCKSFFAHEFHEFTRIFAWRRREWEVKNLRSQRGSERLGEELCGISKLANWGISKLANWGISKLANWKISKLVYSFIVFTFKFFEVVAFEGVFDELGEAIGGAGETGDAEFADFLAEFFVVIRTTAIGKG